MPSARHLPRLLQGLILLAAAIGFAAHAQDPGPLTKEPERYAYVAGVTDYTAHGSSFGDLLTACDEAVRFRQSLLTLGWEASHIFPQVTTPSGQAETETNVRAAICDPTNVALAGGLKTFSDMLLDSQDNPLGVVYLSGHGAQSNGYQYFFGSDATIDFDRELRRASAPHYKVLSDSGVDVLSLFSQLSGVKGKAFLIIIDACRNNAALEKYRADAARARTANPELLARLDRLSADYLAAKGPITNYNTIFSNIVVMFSTRPGKEAAGAPAGSSTEFSQTVMGLLTEDIVSDSAAAFAEETIRRSVDNQVARPEYEKQIPERVGVMARRPVFCFKGCPQPLSVWPHEETRVIASSEPSPQVFAPPRPAPGRPTATRLAAAPPAARLIKARYQAAPAEAALPETAARVAIPPALRSMNIDVFYCLGDASVGDRQTEALRYAEALRRAIPVSTIINGYYLDRIRLRSFDPATNPSMARGKSGTSIWIDRNSPLERTWSARMAALYSTPIPVRQNLLTTTQDYISVFFCGDLRNAQPTSTVYAQVSRRSSTSYAARLIADLKAELPALRFEPKIDAVDDRYPDKTHVPNTTVVRYYSEDQRPAVDELVAKLSARLAFPARAERLRSAAQINPVIEIWFGLNETASWTSDPVGKNPAANVPVS